MIAALSFTAPWLLAALVVLPLLWLLLRAIPPAPVRQRFPAVTLLLTLNTKEVETDRTPWWLLLIRPAGHGRADCWLCWPVLGPRSRRAL